MSLSSSYRSITEAGQDGGKRAIGYPHRLLIATYTLETTTKNLRFTVYHIEYTYGFDVINLLYVYVSVLMV